MANTFLRNDGTFVAIAAADVGAGLGYFHVDRNGSNQTVVAATPTKIAFSNKVSDPSAWFDATTNFRFTPQLAGTWLIIMKVDTTGANTDGAVAFIYKNGSQAFRGTYTAANGTNNNDSIAVALVTFNGSTDYVEGWAQSPTTTVAGTATATFMQGIKLA